MPRSQTEVSSLRVVNETALGTPATTKWEILDFDDLPTLGAEYATAERNPITANRGARKPTIVDKDSGIEIAVDLTMQSLLRFAEGFTFAEFANTEFDLRMTGDVLPPAAVTDGYTVDSSALLAGKLIWVTGQVASLVFAKGYATSANNGLKALTADFTGTGTAETVTTAGQGVVSETPPTSATLEVCGIRVLNDADLTLTVSGSTATLESGAAFAAASITWATLGIQAGMWIHIGSPTSTGALQNALGAGGTTSYGYARVTSVSGVTLNLDKLSSTLATATGPASASQDVMFGRFARNVASTANSDDNRYLERTHHFEQTWDDLGGVGTNQYEYILGATGNSIAIQQPLSGILRATYGFVASNTDPITASRKTGASDARSPIRTLAFNTASDPVAISTDIVSSASDICVKEGTLTIENGITAEKCQGTLGASFINTGRMRVRWEGTMLFTNKSIIDAITNNTTVTMSRVFRNADGAMVFDMPSAVVSGGKRNLPRNESVTVDLVFTAFTSPTFNFDVGFSFFAAVPGVVA